MKNQIEQFMGWLKNQIEECDGPMIARKKTLTEVFDIAGEIFTGNCEYCGHIFQDNPGDYYHRKDCEAKHLSKQLENETDPQIRIKIAKRLAMARYVGD